MKATGIVRRIDDLGRVVIPKEIRRTMRIREGDPLEIYTNTDGEVIFKKYSAINEMSENAVHVADVINKLAGCPVVIFDRDHVVATSGVSKKEFAKRRVTPSLEGVMESRTNYFKTGENAKLQAAEGIEKSAIAAVPIISSGDVTGAVVFMEHENDAMINDLQKSLANAAAQFLGRQIEG
ncbi:MAG: stage V sporulation T C-terminal domain-containing protein [Ruminococcus sp.]|nr:stage V sporulation T C-terminal domain-containing protein [Ruminococcus sp.]